MSTNKRFRTLLTTGLVLALAVAWMYGKGTLLDPRSDDASRSPIAANAGVGPVRNDRDLATSRLPALRIFDGKAAERGKLLFDGKAKCATCHVPLIFTEPGGLHSAADKGIDGFATLGDVVGQQNAHLGLGLSETETKDLVEYLKSL